MAYDTTGLTPGDYIVYQSGYSSDVARVKKIGGEHRIYLDNWTRLNTLYTSRRTILFFGTSAACHVVKRKLDLLRDEENREFERIRTAFRERRETTIMTARKDL